MMSDADEDHGEISVLFEGDHKSYIMPTNGNAGLHRPRRGAPDL